MQHHGHGEGAYAADGSNEKRITLIDERVGAGVGGGDSGCHSGGPAMGSKGRALNAASDYLALQRAMMEATGGGGGAARRPKMQRQLAGVLSDSAGVAASVERTSTAPVALHDSKLRLQQGSMSGNFPPHLPCPSYGVTQPQLGPQPPPQYVTQAMPGSSLSTAAPGHAVVGMLIPSHLTLEELKQQQQQQQRQQRYQHHQQLQQLQELQQLQQLQYLQQLQQHLLVRVGATGVFAGFPHVNGTHRPNTCAQQLQQQQQQQQRQQRQQHKQRQQEHIAGLQNMALGLRGGVIPPQQVAESPARSGGGVVLYPPGAAAIEARAAPASEAAWAQSTGTFGPWSPSLGWSDQPVDGCKTIDVSHVQAASFQPETTYRRAFVPPPVTLDEYQRMVSCVGAGILLQQDQHHYQPQGQVAVAPAAGLNVRPVGFPFGQDHSPPLPPPAMDSLDITGGHGGGGGLHSLANVCLREPQGRKSDVSINSGVNP